MESTEVIQRLLIEKKRPRKDWTIVWEWEWEEMGIAQWESHGNGNLLQN